MREIPSKSIVGWVEVRNPTQLHQQTRVGFHIRSTQPTKLNKLANEMAEDGDIR